MPEFVYVIHAVGTRRFKIGFSKNPSARLRELQTASPFKLCLLGFWEGTQAQEARWHRAFQDHRRSGEWFEFPIFFADCLVADIQTGKSVRVTACGCTLPREKGYWWRHEKYGHVLYEVSYVNGKRRRKYLRYYTHRATSKLTSLAEPL